MTLFASDQKTTTSKAHLGNKQWSIIRLAAVVAAAGSILLAGAQPETPGFAQTTPDGKSLVIPADQASMGTAYYTIPDRDRQVFFESNAPLEDIKGQSNKVIGYAIVSPSTPGEIVAGEWHLPVTSMKTGIKKRDGHLASDMWLDAKSFPNIVFHITQTENLRLVKKTASFASYSGTLVGDLFMHGVTHHISIPNATITMLKASPATARVAKGDLMAIRSKFSVSLKDYGVSHPVIGEKVANTVHIDVSLYLSSEPPARQ